MFVMVMLASEQPEVGMQLCACHSPYRKPFYMSYVWQFWAAARVGLLHLLGIQKVKFGPDICFTPEVHDSLLDPGQPIPEPCQYY